jgi:hypothetical protein
MRGQATLRLTGVPITVLLIAGTNCGDSAQEVVEPREMTITSPTSESTFATTATELHVGGTITGLEAADFLPFQTGAVVNETNGDLSNIRLQGDGTWRTTVPVTLSSGDNRIHAFADLASGGRSDFLTITREP